MLSSEDANKKPGEAQPVTEGAEAKQSGEAEKLEEVPIAEPVVEKTEAKPESKPEAAAAETETETATEGEKTEKKEGEKEEKLQQPEQEPGEVGKDGNPATNPVHAPTGEGDLEKGNEAAGEEKKQEDTSKKYQPDPTFAELRGSAVELLHKHGGWGWFVTFASFILLIQSAVVLSETRGFFFVAEAKFSVAYAVITMCATFTFAMVMKFKGVPEKPRQMFIVILLLWVIIGTGIITFRGPFFLLSNGYFAAWATLIGSYWMFKHEAMSASQYVEDFRANAGYLTTLFVTSLIQFFSAVAFCSGTVCDGLTIYSVVVGVVSALACIVLALATSPGGIERKVAYSFLLLWWFAAICALTFTLQSRFAIAGNGFFSLWASFVVSGILTFLEFREKPGLAA